jgi:predicted HTH transcriptional regulator
MSPEEQHSSAFRFYRDLARVCRDYTAFFPPDSIALIVEAGESSTVEFKSSLRWDLRQNKKNDDITHASLKTMAAFMNTKGGTLLIGVGDDGTAVGIEVDRFPNDDRFLLHLYAVIKSSMGTDVTPMVEANLDIYAGKTVCVVRCKSSARPIYLKAKGKDEEFFVRTGPSSDRLAPSELTRYIADRFTEDQ